MRKAFLRKEVRSNRRERSHGEWRRRRDWESNKHNIIVRGQRKYLEFQGTHFRVWLNIERNIQDKAGSMSCETIIGRV